MADVFADPHYRARETLVDVEDEELGDGLDRRAGTAHERHPGARRSRRPAARPRHRRRCSPSSATAPRRSQRARRRGLVTIHDARRGAVRALLRGVRGRRRLPALAGPTHHRGRGSPLLHADDGRQPGPRRRALRGDRDGGRPQPRRRDLRLRAAARHERPRYRRARRSPHSAPSACATWRRSITATRSTERARSSRHGRLASRPGAGVVTIETRGYNQDGTLGLRVSAQLPRPDEGLGMTVVGAHHTGFHVADLAAVARVLPRPARIRARLGAREHRGVRAADRRLPEARAAPGPAALPGSDHCSS